MLPLVLPSVSLKALQSVLHLAKRLERLMEKPMVQLSVLHWVSPLELLLVRRKVLRSVLRLVLPLELH